MSDISSIKNSRPSPKVTAIFYANPRTNRLSAAPFYIFILLNFQILSSHLPHPDLPSRLNHIDVSNQRCIELLNGRYARSVLSRDCRKHISSLDGVIDGLWSALCMEQLIHSCLHSSVVIPSSRDAILPIITVTPLPSEHLAGKFIHRLMRLGWCNRLRCGCLFCISVKSARLDDGRIVLIGDIQIRVAVDAIYPFGSRILPDPICSAICALRSILSYPVRECRKLRIIQTVAEAGIGGAVDPGIVSSCFRCPNKIDTNTIIPIFLALV